MNTVRHEPSIRLAAFDCPNCGAHAHQDWYDLLANEMGKDKKPFYPNKDWWDFIENEKNIDAEMRIEFKAHAERITGTDIYLQKRESSAYGYFDVNNIHLSECFSCNRFALWFGDRLLYPERGSLIRPNADMPSEVLSDYVEAQNVAAASPRSAAALLRLAIQKILVHLQVDSKDINGSIKELVERGLDVRVQRSLDIVRVVGNNAVHPGQMDVSDDRGTVNQLFHLINIICDYGISQPKMVDALYERLPDGAREQIERRDKT
jgi:hypothetical protein